MRATHGEACLARTRRGRRSPGRRRAELGDDRRAPAVSLSGRRRAELRRLAGPEGQMGRCTAGLCGWRGCWAGGAVAGCQAGPRRPLLQAAARWAGLVASAGWACWLGRVGGLREIKAWGLGLLEKGFKHKNSNLNLNSSKQKKCTSMNATINSYISLTLF
jgi:hypothetical protein